MARVSACLFFPLDRRGFREISRTKESVSLIGVRSNSEGATAPCTGRAGRLWPPDRDGRFDRGGALTLFHSDTYNNGDQQWRRLRRTDPLSAVRFDRVTVNFTHFPEVGDFRFGEHDREVPDHPDPLGSEPRGQIAVGSGLARRAILVALPDRRSPGRLRGVVVLSRLSCKNSTPEPPLVRQPISFAMFAAPRIADCFVAHPRHGDGYDCGSLRALGAPMRVSACTQTYGLPY